MKTTLRFLIPFSAILFFACCSSNETRNGISDNDTTLIQKSLADNPLDTLKAVESTLPKTFLFKYSECIENCNDNERIISLKKKGDSLFLKFGAIQNCIGKFQPKIRFHNDILEIDIEIKGEIVKRKSGKIDTIMVSTECDCYFYFELGINNVSIAPKAIFLNGHKIGTEKSNHIIAPEDPSVLPEFIGGTDSLMRYLNRNVNYPAWEKQNGIQGTVYVTFTVDKEGKIKSPRILRSVNGAKNFDAEALRVVNNMPDWKPAEIKNEKIEAEFYLPIKFKL